MKAPSFWYKPPGWMSHLLSPLGWLYGRGGKIWKRFFRPTPLPIPVISIGNITCGGAGKTPVSIALADLLTSHGHTVHFVTRGYGGTLKGPVEVNPQIHTAKEVGDEPLLLARYAPTWVAKRKKMGVRQALQQGAEIVILDDGHQTNGVYKTISFIVVDSLQRFGNGYVIPAGPLREPLEEGLSRADGLIGIGEGLFEISLPFFRAHLRFSPLSFRDRPCVAFCGLAFPEKFYKSLRERGVQLAMTQSFPDHYVYREKDLFELQASAQRHDAVLVTTRKDWVRLPEEWKKTVYVLDMDLCFQEPRALYKMISEKLFP